jgi:hypothetical protein
MDGWMDGWMDRYIRTNKLVEALLSMWKSRDFTVLPCFFDYAMHAMLDAQKKVEADRRAKRLRGARAVCSASKNL